MSFFRNIEEEQEEQWIFETKTKASNYVIYSDLDGVICDFDGRFEHFTGISAKTYREMHGTMKFWNLIDNEIGAKYWAEMEWMKRGRELWSFISPYKPILLTTPSRNGVSRIGKRQWVEENIQPSPKLLFSFHKEEYAKPNAILIDDRASNLEAWEKAGGIAIECKYDNIEPVIKRLKELGF